MLTVALVVSVASRDSGEHRARLLAAELWRAGLMEVEPLVAGMLVNTGGGTEKY